MTTYNQFTRISIMKWRDKNADKYREDQRVYQLAYYKTHGYNKEVKKRYYEWKKICRQYLDVLCNLTA